MMDFVAIRQEHVLIFLANSDRQPWPCYFCGDDVFYVLGPAGQTARRGLVVHHVNHEETDHAIENLVPAHRTCHASHHGTGRVGPLKMNAQRRRCRECGLVTTPGAMGKHLTGSCKGAGWETMPL